MKKIINFIILGFFLFVGISPSFSQKVEKKINDILAAKGEIFFSFQRTDKSALDAISKYISIEKINGSRVYAYANKKQFARFRQSGIEFEIIDNTPPAGNIQMARSLKDVMQWNYYPTYPQYLSLMDSLAAAYPELCRIDTIGYSINGRLILALKISDNVTQEEVEPEFMYTSTMHGDEPVGYVLMLHLADYLLSNYGAKAKITRLVNEIEIYINPLSNPDGLYAGGDSTVAGAVRFNANGVDLNRNFPDPAQGPHPDDSLWQPETIAMMSFLTQHNFVLSANIHSGSEVLNYPWDTWQRPHADDSWLQYISRQYADTVHLYCPSNYLDDFNNGIVNGYSWYWITGGRQDYMTYYLHGREITFELSNGKLLPASTLPAYWNYNYRSLLNYMEQSLFGLRGIVTDSLTGAPLRAKVELLGYETDSSQIFSDATNGNYHRMNDGGVFSTLFSSPGYGSKVYRNVFLLSETVCVQNVQLSQWSNIEELSPSFIRMSVFPNPIHTSVDFYIDVPEGSNVFIELCDAHGKNTRVVLNDKLPKGNHKISFDASSLIPGIYYAILLAGKQSVIKKVVKL